MTQKALGSWETARARPASPAALLWAPAGRSSGPCRTSAHARVRAHQAPHPKSGRQGGRLEAAHAKAAPTRAIFVAFPPCSHALDPLNRHCCWPAAGCCTPPSSLSPLLPPLHLQPPRLLARTHTPRHHTRHQL